MCFISAAFKTLDEQNFRVFASIKEFVINLSFGPLKQLRV